MYKFKLITKILRLCLARLKLNTVKLNTQIYVKRNKVTIHQFKTN